MTDPVWAHWPNMQRANDGEVMGGITPSGALGVMSHDGDYLTCTGFYDSRYDAEWSRLSYSELTTKGWGSKQLVTKLPVGVRRQRGIFVGNKLHVFNGTDYIHNTAAYVHLSYDFVAKTWTQYNTTPLKGATDQSGFPLQDDRFPVWDAGSSTLALVGGGNGIQQVDYWNAATDTWIRQPDIPVAATLGVQGTQVVSNGTFFKGKLYVVSEYSPSRAHYGNVYDGTSWKPWIGGDAFPYSSPVQVPLTEDASYIYGVPGSTTVRIDPLATVAPPSYTYTTSGVPASSPAGIVGAPSRSVLDYCTFVNGSDVAGNPQIYLDGYTLGAVLVRVPVLRTLAGDHGVHFVRPDVPAPITVS